MRLPTPTPLLAASLALVLALAISAGAQVSMATLDGTSVGGLFATALAWSSGRLIVGAPFASAPFEPPTTGTITVYEWRGGQWRNPLPWPASGTATGDEFGAALASDDAGLIIVGSPRAHSTSGPTSGKVQILDVMTMACRYDLLGEAAGHWGGSRVAWIGYPDGTGASVLVARSYYAHGYMCRCQSGAFRAARVRASDTTGWLWNTYSTATRIRYWSLCNQGYRDRHTRNGRIGYSSARLGGIGGNPDDEFAIRAMAGHHNGAPTQRVLIYDSATLLRSENMADLVRTIVPLGDVNGDQVPDCAVDMDGNRVDIMDEATAGVRLRTIRGPGGNFGRAMANAGDFDGDGVDDLLIGAPNHESDRGWAYIVSGASGDLLWMAAGMLPDGRFDASVVALDDVTGDGVPEFAVGSPAANSDTGRVSIFSVDASLTVRTGVGCAPTGTSDRIPNIGTPAGPPTAGNATFAINVTRVASPRAAFLIFAFVQYPAPANLGAIIPQLGGCYLYPDSVPLGTVYTVGQTQPLHATNTSGAGGWAELVIPIPATFPTGIPIHAQWFVFDPGPFPVPAVMTQVLTL